MNPTTPENQQYQMGILGYPLSHTLSPVLHRIFLDASGLHGQYTPYPTPPEQLQERITTLKSQGLRGLNITIPHKVAAMQFINTLDEETRLIQAVNTLVFEPEGTIKGFNTDITGFSQSLPIEVRETLFERHALMLGAGGAARAVVASLISLGISGITLAARNPDNAQDVVKLAHKLAAWHENSLNLHLLNLSELHTLSDFSLVINCTPIGLKNNGNDTETPLSDLLLKTVATHGFISDLVYGKQETPLVRQCKRLGIAAKDGLDMLIYQGAESFRLWTGHTCHHNTIESARQQLRARVNHPG